LNKAANIYWDSSEGKARTERRSATRRTRAKADHKTAPGWLPYVIVASIFVMLIISINFRSFMDMREEVEQNQRLSTQIQSLMDENLALQEEIHTLKSDPAAIGREAKRIGIDVKNSQ
jgi:cell division protein FtsB